MNNRKSALPEIILARLARGSVPLDGHYWLERQNESWLSKRAECSHDDGKVISAGTTSR